MLSDNQLRLALRDGQLSIHPYADELVQPASIDLRLGSQFAHPNSSQKLVQPFLVEDPESFWRFQETESIVLKPGQFCLAHTLELVNIGPTIYGRVEGKSTLGRWGLLVHTTAGFIDPGFKGRITLELRNVGPFNLVLYYSMRICQLAVGLLHGEISHPYDGRYLGNSQIGLPY